MTCLKGMPNENLRITYPIVALDKVSEKAILLSKDNHPPVVYSNSTPEENTHRFNFLHLRS